MSVVIVGIGNTAGAVSVTVAGGLGVSPRTRALVPSGTAAKRGEAISVAVHCIIDRWG